MSRKLNEVARKETEQYHQRKAVLFYEMAFGELLSQFSLSRALEIVNGYLDQLGEEQVADNKGWVCPICKTVHNPETKTCAKCTQQEQSAPGGPQLLQE